MTTDLSSLLALLALCLSFVYYDQRKKAKSRFPLPPGPKPWPIFGNIFDLPVHKPWIVYRDWSQKYGADNIYLDLPHQPTVILNSSQAILDLMEGRSKLYADKPEIVMDELLGWDWNVGFMPYGPRWRTTRRTIHQYFNQHAVKHYHSIQSREVHMFLKRAAAAASANSRLDANLLSQTFAAIILDIAYGMKIHDFADEFMSLSRKAVEGITLGRLPGVFWVEYFPWLKYIPSWVPGSSARKFADRYRPAVEAVRSKAFYGVMDDVNNGTAVSSIAHKLAQKLQDHVRGTDSYKEHEQTARDATGIVYAAAVDTQLSAASSFLLAMTLAPDVQRRGQRELESIVGPRRLPTMEDIPSLPYIQAILLETLRWIPTLPLGVAHRAMVDDEYKGFAIPAGATVIANVWAMLHDAAEYPDPEAFNPDRFMSDGALRPDVRGPIAAFGFGRRICPGRHLANESLLLMIASILHVFNIEATTDVVSTGATTGLFSYPESLPCRLIPRSEAAMELINSA